MNDDLLQDINNELFNLLEDANRVLDDELSLFYSGNFITGELKSPAILFLGINPGFSADEWPSRIRQCVRYSYSETLCKYYHEYDDQYKLAKNIVDVLLDGDSSRLLHCAETSFRSFYATPSEKILEKQINALRYHDMFNRHEALMKNFRKYLTDNIAPKNIVCIGLSTFARFVTLFAGRNPVISMKSMPSSSGKTEPVYYKKTVVNGIPVHGVIHLSGAHPSSAMLDELHAIFNSIPALTTNMPAN